MEEFFAAPWQGKVALCVLFAALAASVVTDLHKRLILNVVTYPALLLVFGCFYSLGGFALVVEALKGLLICALPLFLASLSGAMGAGDVKLMAVCGAVAGAVGDWRFPVNLLLNVSIAGGVQSVAWLLAAKVRGQARPKHVPYGVAIAAGTALAFLWGSALL